MRRGVGGLAVVAVLAVGGCSGAPPTPAPIAEPSSSGAVVTPTATPAPTPTPQAWEVRSVEGADAFARHWVEVFNEASITGDLSRFEKLNLPRCVTCANYTQRLNRIYGPGGHMEMSGWVVRQLAVSPAVTNGRQAVNVILRVDQPAERDIFRNPRRVETFTGGTFTWIMHLSWSSGGWLVSEMELT